MSNIRKANEIAIRFIKSGEGFYGYDYTILDELFSFAMANNILVVEDPDFVMVEDEVYYM